MPEISAPLVELGARLREERERLDLNQTDFGRLGGVNRSSQQEYEVGKRPFSATYLVGLGASGVDAGYVLTGDRKPEPAAPAIELVTMRVALPPRPALAEMFAAVLEIYPDLHGAALAQALARHLPSALARIAGLPASEDAARAPSSAAADIPRAGRPARRQG